MKARQLFFHTASQLRFAFIATVLIVGLSTHPVAQPSTTVQTPQSSDRAAAGVYLKLFGDVFERLRFQHLDRPSDEQILTGAIKGLFTGLDPQSYYITPKEFNEMKIQTKGGTAGIGLELTLDNGFAKVVSPIDDTPAHRSGIRPGDLIIAIDGKSTKGLSLNDVVDKLRGTANSQITLTVRRPGDAEPREIPIIREIIRIQVVKSRLEADRIGYIRLVQFTEKAESAIRAAANLLVARAGGTLRALVLDLRNNPGGLLDSSIAVSAVFLEKGEIVSTEARYPDDSQRWDAHGKDILGGAPLVVLTNGGCYGSCEIVAGALQFNRRAVLLGTRTYGGGTVQTVIPLPGGGAMRVTTARYVTPSGRWIQAGIDPDVRVWESRDEANKVSSNLDMAQSQDLIKQDRMMAGNDAPRKDLPPIAASIPDRPPEGFPKFDPIKPSETDFQFIQALVLAEAMATAVPNRK